MIFVTVGGQVPFDRLVNCVDHWANQAGLPRGAVLAQIGSSAAPPRSIEWTRKLSPADYRRRISESRVIIAHAGIGAILTASDLCKPILVMPRRAGLKEHRNDHQLATARHLQRTMNLAVAWDEQELRQRLDRLDAIPIRAITSHTHGDLTAFLRDFIDVN